MQVLVEVHRFGKVRPSTVSHRLWRASRYGLNATLVDLVDHELVRRDAGGYFSLTSRGRHIARVGGRLLFQLRQLRVEDVALRKWSLPVILALSERGKRFNALRRCLPGTTARALAATLKNLQHAELVERIVFLTYAPQTYYYLRFRTKRLVPLLAQL